MAPDEFEALKQRFGEHVESYIASTLDNRAYVLKKHHTLRVLNEADNLGRELVLNDRLMILVRAAALLHDIGRFRQFRDYGTFLDRASRDHAELGLEEIADLDLLGGFSAHDRSLVTTAIRFHNAAAIPGEISGDGLVLVKVVRDADKLDIWRVMVDHYCGKRSEKDSYISLGMEDGPDVSAAALEAIQHHSIVKISMVRTLNDLKLMQMSWVFDLNFPESIAKVMRRGYIDAIASTLPASRDMDGVARFINNYMEETSVNGILSH